ncbi:MAG: DNA repair protein RecO [Desulfobacterium sp.]|jgi:DNA repair protein RecO (recombination protein O)|nr:DNA repair protein RecO [Desulfobacterium sp.]
MSGFSTDGIILKRIEYGDNDLIVTYFTTAMGRISVIAKNARKSVKRFAGALEPFSVMNLECTWPRRKNALPMLNLVDLCHPFAKIRTSVVKTGYACYWLELINFSTEEGKQQEDLYNLLFYVLKALDQGSMEKEILSLLFQIRFMNLSGLAPDLTSCGNCSTALDGIAQQRVFFDFSKGSLVCDRCRRADRQSAQGRSVIGQNRIDQRTINRNGGGQIVNNQYSTDPDSTGRGCHGITVSRGTLKQLLWINNSDLNRADRLRFSPNAVTEGERLLESFIPCHLGREVNSLLFLRRIREVG